MKRQRGFNLIELALAAGVLATVSLSLASGVSVSANGARTLDHRSRLEEQGQMYLERLSAIPFGTSADAAAQGGDLTELFDEDEIFGVATLHSLRAFGPIQFKLNNAGFPGGWRILVDRDLNGDGDESDDAEGRNDLLRCAIFYDGRLVDQVIRFDAKGDA